MQFKAFPYQTYGIQKIIDLPEAGAFLDMGLGKTVMTLTAIKELKARGEARRVLVIAPKKVAENVWTDEIARWDHLKGLTTSLVLGPEKERRRALSAKADIYLINRENVTWLVGLLGAAWNFDMLVIDELSSFKSHQSQRFKSLKLIRRYCKRVVGLTGTPTPNGLLDLWSQVWLLDRGQRLGESFGKYRAEYFNAGGRNGHVVYDYKLKKGDELLGADFFEKEIHSRIGDICFSMKSEDYLSLPERLDRVRYIELPAPDMAKYLAFEREQVLKLAEKEVTALSAAALTNKLLQYANGAVYDDDKAWHLVHDEKLDALREIHEGLAGNPVLVFYTFKSDRDRIMKAVPSARELKTPQDIRDWSEGKIDMLVAHPASAGHGLNLQFGGHNALWFGCPWSLELYQQGIKRLHRTGQGHPVANTRLVTRGTMDEEVVAALERKEDTQDAVMRAIKARIEKYLGKQ